MSINSQFQLSISEMLFNTKIETQLERSLLQLTYQDLQRRLEEHIRQISLLNDAHRHNMTSEELVIQQEKKRALTRKITSLKADIHKVSSGPIPLVELEKIITISPELLDVFSRKFRDLKHLAFTLSDAPRELKSVQTKLNIQLLSGLDDKQEQEKQLASLSPKALDELIIQAIEEYRHLQDEKLKNECKILVQMALFEVVQQECQKIPVNNVDTQADYDKRKEFLDGLSGRIPDVGASDVIDNLGKYKNSSNRTIGELLFAVDRKLKINPNDDYGHSTAIQSSFIRDKLRFGFDDLRDYVKKCQNNITRDLFWARNIRDIEIFTKGISSQLFENLELQRLIGITQLTGTQKRDYQIARNLLRQSKKGAPEFDVLIQFSRALDVWIQKSKKDVGIKAAFYKTPNESRRATAAESFKKDVLGVLNNTLDITCDPKTERVTLKFFYIDPNNDILIKDIFDKMSSSGYGLNSSALTYTNTFRSESILTDSNCLYHSFEGGSFKEILEKLELRRRELEAPQVKATKKESESNQLELRAVVHYITVLKARIEQVKPQCIDDLNLSASDELLIRKLLELRMYHKEMSIVPLDLQSVFDKLKCGDYISALKTESLDKLVYEEYQKLASVDLDSAASETLKKIIDTAKTLQGSSQERQASLDEFNRVWDTSAYQAPNERANEIVRLFKREYEKMSGTLQLSPQQFAGLDTDFQVMADEICHLMNRIPNGMPAFEEKEREACFDALSQIQAQLPDGLKLTDVSFKIRHSIAGEQEITVTRSDGVVLAEPIKINIESPLRYSLTKPPANSECYFSFGGSRGNFAPFAGCDEVYGKRRRYFTASRVLGDGQYGTVKLGRGILSAANYAVKKGIAAGGFEEEARKDLRLRPITRRTDPLSKHEARTLKHLTTTVSMDDSLDGSIAISYYENSGKKRKKGKLHKQEVSLEYSLISPLAAGQTYADAVQSKLGHFTKDALAYHQPQVNGSLVDEIKERLNLAQAVVSSAESFMKEGFAHNDIKPENFLTKRRSDGSYCVTFIDWATGGYEKNYLGKNTDPKELFKENFDTDIAFDSIKNVQTEEIVYINSNGQFIREVTPGQFIFGANPHLQILHGARNGTVPYISPCVVFKENQYIRCSKASLKEIFKEQFGTEIDYGDPLQFPVDALDKNDEIIPAKLTANRIYVRLIEGKAPASAVVSALASATEDALEYWIKDEKDEVVSYRMTREDISLNMIQSLIKVQQAPASMSSTKKTTVSASLRLSKLELDSAKLANPEFKTRLFAIALQNDHLPGYCSEIIDAKGMVTYANSKGQYVRREGRSIVYGDNLDWNSQDAGVEDKKFDTVLKSNDPRMDDWSLTAMCFGICNRKAYLKLINGRVVNDYIIPGVFAEDDTGEFGLRIENAVKFNEFFACEENDRLSDRIEELKPQLENRNAVMYIPSTQREGEPFHVYRLLSKIRQLSVKDSEIYLQADRILKTVYQSIAEGKGLTKDELKRQLNLAKLCIKNFEHLQDESHKTALKKAEIFDEIVASYSTEQPFTANELLKQKNRVSHLEIVMTYPNNEHQRNSSLDIMKRIITPVELMDKFIGKVGCDAAPFQDLFKKCIDMRQNAILILLLSLVQPKMEKFYTIVLDEGLLHYALQQGMTDVAKVMIIALKKVSPNTLFDLMLTEYGVGEGYKSPAPEYLQWNTNTLHIAIRNNNDEQLMLLLSELPENNRQYDNIIYQSLYLCASLSNSHLFHLILSCYNEKNSSNHITAEKLFSSTFLPDNSTSYHLLLKSESTSSALDWETLLSTPDLAKQFILSKPYPILIAAREGNIYGVKRLIQLAMDVKCTDLEMHALFTQADEDGKNIVNHILVQHQSDYLNELIQKVKEGCATNNIDVLYEMMTNPYSSEPKNNLLVIDESGPKQVAILKTLLDSLCQNHHDGGEYAEDSRVKAIAENQNCFVRLAQECSNEALLRGLLQNDALSNPAKQKIFNILHDACQEGTQEKSFYETLLCEVMPKGAVKFDDPLKQSELENSISQIFLDISVRRCQSIKRMHPLLVEAQLFQQHQVELQESIQRNQFETEYADELVRLQQGMIKDLISRHRLSESAVDVAKQSLLELERSQLIDTEQQLRVQFERMAHEHKESMIALSSQFSQEVLANKQEIRDEQVSREEASKNLDELNERFRIKEAEFEENLRMISAQMVTLEDELNRKKTEAMLEKDHEIAQLNQQIHDIQLSERDLHEESEGVLKRQVESLRLEAKDILERSADESATLKIKLENAQQTIECQKIKKQTDDLVNQTVADELTQRNAICDEERLDLIEIFKSFMVENSERSISATEKQHHELQQKCFEMDLIALQKSELEERVNIQHEGLTSNTMSLVSLFREKLKALIQDDDTQRGKVQELTLVISQMREKDEAKINALTLEIEEIHRKNLSLEEQLSFNEMSSKMLELKCQHSGEQLDEARSSLALEKENLREFRHQNERDLTALKDNLQALLSQREQMFAELEQKIENIEHEDELKSILTQLEAEAMSEKISILMDYSEQTSRHMSFVRDWFKNKPDDIEVALPPVYESGSSGSFSVSGSNTPPQLGSVSKSLIDSSRASETSGDIPSEPCTISQPLNSYQVYAFRDADSISKKDVFSSEDEKPICCIRYNVIELLPSEIEFLKTKPGLPVKSPSGHQYYLCDVFDGRTTASISNINIHKNLEDESDDEKHQRIAVTIMNMIDNVLAKKNIIDVQTDDPFIAEISRQYIAYLKLTCGIKLECETLPTLNAPEQTQLAVIVFNQLSPQLGGVEGNPALKAYVERNEDKVAAAREALTSLKKPSKSQSESLRL